jgi:hypothetical protein
MKKYKIGCQILMANGVIFIAIGLFMVFFNKSALFVIVNKIIDPLFWSDEILSKGTLNFKSLMWTFTGMFHIIWGVFIVYIVKFGFMKKRESWAWKSIGISVITWLLVDTYFSLSMKLYTITFNPTTIFFAIIFIVPLIMTKDALKNREI